MKPIADISEVKLLSGIVQPTDQQRALMELCLLLATSSIRQYLKFDPVYNEHTEFRPMMDLNPNRGEGVWEVSDTKAYERFRTNAASNLLQMQHLPIRSITSLKIDHDGRSGTKAGSFGSETAKIEGEDFWPNYNMVDSEGGKVCEDGMIRSAGMWPIEPGSIKVVYFAGYKPKELRGQDSVLDASHIWDVCLNETMRRFVKAKQQFAQNAMAGFTGPLTSENFGDYSYTADGSLLGRMIGGTNLMPESIEKLSGEINYGAMLNS